MMYLFGNLLLKWGYIYSYTRKMSTTFCKKNTCTLKIISYPILSQSWMNGWKQKKTKKLINHRKSDHQDNVQKKIKSDNGESKPDKKLSKMVHRELETLCKQQLYSQHKHATN